MKRSFLLPLLIALTLGGAVIAGQNDAGVKVIYDVMPNHMADNNNPEPLFLRGLGSYDPYSGVRWQPGPNMSLTSERGRTTGGAF